MRGLGDKELMGDKHVSLFDATTIALVGASERMAYSINLVKNLRLLGFDMRRFYPVNPHRAEVFGQRCYESILDVPERVDVAVVATPTDAVYGVLEGCAQKGVRTAVVLADGFAESGRAGRELEERLADIARSATMAVVGPNCMGYVAPHAGLGVWAGELPANLHAGNVAAVFQSSGVLNLFLTLASERKLGFRTAVSVGNQAVLTTADFLRHAIEDPAVQVVTLFLESVPKPEVFFAALVRAERLRKPVIALHVGRSDRGQRNALAHTGRLAGSGVAWQAALRQHGVVLVEDLDELLEATVLFAGYRAGQTVFKNGVGFVTISGGDCTLLCDLADREGIRLPDVSQVGRDEMVARLQKPTLLGNPFDIENLQRQDEASFYRCMEVFLEERDFAFVGCRLGLPKTLTPEGRNAYVRVATIAKERNQRLVYFSRASESISDDTLLLFEELGVPFLKEYRKGLRTIRRFLEYEERLAYEHGESSPATPIERERTRHAQEIVRGSKTQVLGIAATRSLLETYEIPLAPMELATTVEDASETARRLGFPVAVKVASPDIPHKSDAGGVALSVQTEAEVRSAYQRVLANVRATAPRAEVEGVIIQKMVDGVAEMILGISYDQQLGPILMFGLGGLFVEIMQDVAFHVGRVTHAEARRLIGEIRASAVLRGARGRPAGDEGALVDVIVRMSGMASDMRGLLAEVDLNPIVVLPAGEGVLAVDALVIRR